MKQVTQRLKDGRVEVLEVPVPAVEPDTVLVDIRASLLSAGTERTKVETARQSLIGKARSRPDQVRQVLDKARRDGLRETAAAVRSRLDHPDQLGYSAAGVVHAVGGRVRDIRPGDRVACAGAGYAVHAELVRVPGNLCARLPDGVGFEAAAFGTVGSIALHGVRQADVRLGERVAVVGLGLVGQLTGQLLRASGCHVVGVDLDAGLVDLALSSGAADAAFRRDELGDPLPHAAANCDAVIITAATPSTDPVELAAALLRDRGRVVVVGDVGLSIPRAPYYGKEIDLRLSRSYGPGRYDREYEERGLDYPIGYVRWTERRNLEAFLGLIATGRLAVEPLITDRVAVDDAPAAYERLVTEDRSPLGIVLTYAPSDVPTPASALPAGAGRARFGPVAVIGCGSFAQRVLIPALRDAGFPLARAASGSGLSAVAASERFPFSGTATAAEAIADPDAAVVAIASRHASHAPLAVQALEAGKPVFVEKPPCIREDDLDHLRRLSEAGGIPLFVGFNRRYAPAAEALRNHLRATRQPITLLFRVNAGALSPDHWLNDLEEGGGRLVGEGCHFVDFACWLCGDLPVTVDCVMRAAPGTPLAAAETFAITLTFADGGMAVVLYEAGGATRLGKERVEAHAGGRSAVIDDWSSLVLLDGSRRTARTRVSGKGHSEEAKAFRALLEGGPAPDPSHLDTMAVTFAALRAAESGRPVPLSRED